MNKKIVKILEISCSGLAGIFLSLGYQHFIAPSPEITVVINGEEVSLTESELQKQLNSTQNKLDTATEQLNELKSKTENIPEIEYSNLNLNVNGELLNNYEDGIININGKNYILFNSLNEIIKDEINFQNDTLSIGNSKEKIVDLMEVCPPYDASDENSYKTDSFKMEGEFYNGFSIKSGYYSESYVLVNLKNNFSNIEFDFGHVDETQNFECTLNVYLDEKL